MRAALFGLVIAGAACSTTTATVRPEPSPLYGSSHVAPAPDTPAPDLLVTTDKSCPASASGCDIIELVDLHTQASSEDKGFDELRRRAAAEGGDAVIGAEFEHGDGAEPSHLSGMVVRYGNPIPPHEDVGRVDIASDEDSEDKGMQEMLERAHAMGGDRVIDVTFEHGDDGAQGHLRGLVIRVKR